MNFKKVVNIVEGGYFLVFFISSLILSIYFITSKDKHVLFEYYGEMGLFLVVIACTLLVSKCITYLYEKKDKEITEELLFTIRVGSCLEKVTVTLFYLLLLYFYISYFHLSFSSILLGIIWVLVITQILLYLYPMKQWTTKEYQSRYYIIRNIPIVIFAGIVNWTFIESTYVKGTSFSYLGLAVVLSFLFYVPMLLHINKYPVINLLMIPKTAMYLWILSMGLAM